MSNVVALSWSPPGLAKHRRCALTILTSNLILSLWASTSDPATLASWERLYVVNTGVYQSLVGNNSLSGSAATFTDPILRRILRIRSVAWAPLLPFESSHNDVRFSGGSDLYFLAITNDDNSVLFLSVSSPYINDSAIWSVRIVTQYNFEKKQTEFEQNLSYLHGSLLQMASNPRPFINRVSWAVWNQAEGRTEIFINFDRDSVSIGNAKFLVSAGFPLNASISNLAVSSTASIFTHNVDRLEISSLNITQSTLHKQALQLRAKYDGQNNYGGLSFIKSWGLATYEKYLAICISIHPGDMVDHVLASEERAMILFSIIGTDRLKKELETFSWEIDSSPSQSLSVQSTIIEAVFDLERQGKVGTGALSNGIIYAVACASMLLWDAERVRRLSLAKELLERLGQRTDTDFSPEINACLYMLGAPGINIAEVAAILGEATGVRSREDITTTGKLFDFCSICAHPINWQSLSDATCSGGHHFGACAASKLGVLNLD